MREFTLVLTDKDLLLLSEALGNVAFNKVAPLIAKLDQQLMAQQKQGVDHATADTGAS